MEEGRARIRPGPARRTLARAGWAVALAIAVPGLVAVSVPVVATGQAPDTTVSGAAVEPVVPEESEAPPPGDADVTTAAETGDTAAVAPEHDGVAAPVTGTGRDPLTPDEAALAEAVALDHEALEGMTDVSGDDGPELLSIELAGEDPDARLADVFAYDYSDDVLVKQVVDLSAGRVVRSATAPGMQPPPSEAEVAAAFALLLADPAGAGLAAQFRVITGEELTAPEQVTGTGASFVAPEGATQAAACGAHRCLTLFAQIPDGPYVDLSALVIDLSDQTVTRLR